MTQAMCQRVVLLAGCFCLASASPASIDAQIEDVAKNARSLTRMAQFSEDFNGAQKIAAIKKLVDSMSDFQGSPPNWEGAATADTDFPAQRDAMVTARRVGCLLAPSPQPSAGPFVSATAPSPTAPHPPPLL